MQKRLAVQVLDRKESSSISTGAESPDLPALWQEICAARNGSYFRISQTQVLLDGVCQARSKATVWKSTPVIQRRQPQKKQTRPTRRLGSRGNLARQCNVSALRRAAYRTSRSSYSAVQSTS